MSWHEQYLRLTRNLRNRPNHYSRHHRSRIDRRNQPEHRETRVIAIFAGPGSIQSASRKMSPALRTLRSDIKPRTSTDYCTASGTKLLVASFSPANPNCISVYPADTDLRGSLRGPGGLRSACVRKSRGWSTDEGDSVITNSSAAVSSLIPY